MARGDQFLLIILGIFFIHSLIAFVIFVGLGKLLNYRFLKDRPVGWRVAGTIGVGVWAIRNIYVHAMDYRDPPNMGEVWVILVPALILLAVVWFTKLLVVSAR